MLAGLNTYGVSGAARKPLIEFMTSALKSAECRILYCSDERTAPFVITFETSTGERIGVVAYAFLATRTPTRNRPVDERSFQIKYGSKLRDNSHRLWIDQHGLYTTLLIGIDPREGFFVAADPAAHNPTKFFIRLEFKDEHAEAILSQGWHAWERAKRAAGFEEPIEVLVGGTKDHFLDLIRFERSAVGLSPGDRQLLAEKPEMMLAPGAGAAEVASIVPKEVLHPLAKELSLDANQILELIANARRLKMAVRGWVAEEHLRNALSHVPGVSRCERLDVEGGPDIHLSYRGQPLITIECKNVLRKIDQKGLIRIDFQRTRASKSDPCSRYYAPSDFDIVAGCLHAVTEKWEFRYALTAELPAHAKCIGKVTSNIRVDANWGKDPTAVFERAYANRR
jgi:restriction-modification system family protein